MKKQIVSVVAALVLCSAGSVWASDEGSSMEENCRTAALEANVPAEELEKFITECLGEQAEPQDDQKEQEPEAEQPVKQ